MIQYFKAIRPDGTSFNDPSFRWVPETGPVEGTVVTHPNAHRNDASGYLSVSTVATDCTGMRWPARLLIVEPLDKSDVFTPRPSPLPNKRAAHAWRVVREADASKLLGTSAAHFLTFLEEIPTRTPEQWHAVRNAVRNAAWGAARGAAWFAAGDAAGSAAWGTARDAERNAAGSAAWDAAECAAWDAAGYAAGDVVGDAAGYAARALSLRDLVGTGSWTAEAYEVLVAPARAAGFTIPPAFDGDRTGTT